MQVDHHFLRGGKVLILLLEESEHHLRTLRRGRKRERPMSPHQTEMLLLPLIQSFWVLSPYKRTAKSVNGSHAVSSENNCTEPTTEAHAFARSSGNRTRQGADTVINSKPQQILIPGHNVIKTRLESALDNPIVSIRYDLPCLGNFTRRSFEFADQYICHFLNNLFRNLQINLARNSEI